MATAQDNALHQSLYATGGFRAASITKSFVATVVLQLVGEHRLRLSDSVKHWRAGVQADPTRPWSARELIAVATAHPPVFPPGTSWSYSNTNYVLAGLIAETVTGRPLPAPTPPDRHLSTASDLARFYRALLSGRSNPDHTPRDT